MQTHSDWLKARQRGLGGSDIAAVLWPHLPDELRATEKAPFKNAVEVWLSKTGDVDDDGGSEAMQDGNELEEVIYNRLLKNAAEQGHHLHHFQMHPEMQFFEEQTDDGGVLPAVVNLDAIGFDDDGPCIGEMKSGGEWAAELWKEDIPFIYYCQVQWYLGWTAINRAYVQMWIFGRVKPFYVVEFNPEFFAMLKQVAAKFWNEYVIPGVVPPMDEASDDVLKALYPGGDTATVELDTIERRGEVVPADEVAELYLAVCDELKQLEDKKKELENQMKAALGNADNGLSAHYAFKWSTFERSSVDLDGLRAAHPELVAEFTQKVRQRRWNKPKKRKVA